MHGRQRSTAMAVDRARQPTAGYKYWASLLCCDWPPSTVSSRIGTTRRKSGIIRSTTTTSGRRPTPLQQELFLQLRDGGKSRNGSALQVLQRRRVKFRGRQQTASNCIATVCEWRIRGARCRKAPPAEAHPVNQAGKGKSARKRYKETCLSIVPVCTEKGANGRNRQRVRYPHRIKIHLLSWFTMEDAAWGSPLSTWEAGIGLSRTSITRQRQVKFYGWCAKKNWISCFWAMCTHRTREDSIRVTPRSPWKSSSWSWVRRRRLCWRRQHRRPGEILGTRDDECRDTGRMIAVGLTVSGIKWRVVSVYAPDRTKPAWIERPVSRESLGLAWWNTRDVWTEWGPSLGRGLERAHWKRRWRCSW